MLFLKKIFLNEHQDWGASILFVLFSGLTSYLVMGWVYPDLLIFHKLAFTQHSDPEIPFEGVFTLLSHYYNGGVQLWNRYDQQNLSFVHLTAGIYTLANLTTASAYVLFSPFFDYPGEAFQSIHASVFHGATILIRTVGGYLLLRRLGLCSWVIFVALIYLNTLLSSTLYLGLLTNCLYSLFPLAIYFVLRFFDGYRLNDFLLFLLIMALAVSNTPLLALGYYYQAIHFFILTCLAASIFTKDKNSIMNLYLSFRSGWSSRNFIKIALTLSLVLVIILPCLVMERTVKDDFYIHEVFDGKADGRMVDKYSIEKYFSKPTIPLPVPRAFLVKSVDFWHNKSYMDWPFLGYSALFFSVAGLLFSRDKRKHLFFWPIILVILLQLPRDPSSLTSAAHWINVLTNPFAFLIRGPHMTALLMPILFLPLVALGIQSIADLISFKDSKIIHRDRMPPGILLVMGLMGYFIFYIPEFVVYVPDFGKLFHIAIKCALFLGLVLIVYCWIDWKTIRFNVITSIYSNRLSILAYGLLISLFLDLFFLKIYIERNSWSNINMFSGVIDSVDDKGLINPFFQNPKILPFREYVNTDRRELTLRLPGSSDMEDIYKKDLGHWINPDPESRSWTKMNTRQMAYGLFYKFTHLGRYFFAPSKYHPRHKIYEGLESDEATQQYLNSDPRILFLADHAVSDKAVNPQIKTLIDARKVVSVDNESPLLYPLSEGSAGDLPRQDSAPGVLSFIFQTNEGNKTSSGQNTAISYDLPPAFPSYIASSIFTRDQYSLSVQVGRQILKPAQGNLVRPFTFDVQNVQTGKLTILLPGDFNAADSQVKLEVKVPEGLLDIWRNEHDNFGFEYKAEKPGWLVLHYPYDAKWQLTLDEKPTKVFKVNKYFIGFPVEKGVHNILLEYWPDTWLREMIKVSSVLIVIVFFGLVLCAIKRENSSIKLDSVLEA